MNPTLKQNKFSRKQLVQYIFIFLIKSGLEAILDILVMPVALGAGLLDFLAGPKHSADLFHRMMIGFKFVDDWIDQFGMLNPGDLESESAKWKSRFYK
jgi:hypothetical protein